MNFAECPSCEKDIKIEGTLRMGRKVKCRHCDADLEITWLNPIELDWVEEYAAYPYDEELEEDFYENFDDD